MIFSLFPILYFLLVFFFFFFNDTATTEIYTLSLHDALPISSTPGSGWPYGLRGPTEITATAGPRSEEHTSELQSPCNLVCRLLLEKKKKKRKIDSANLISKRCRSLCSGCV